MKINMPVTNVETLLPENEFIYSATDLKGVIVEANEAFATVSNYTREEMIGQSHNMVRHPDRACPNFCVNGVLFTAEGYAPRTEW